MANNSTYEERIEAAIADLESQDIPRYRPTAKKYSVQHSTLRRRFLGLQTSRAIADSESRKRLTNVQEDVLIGHINDLSERGLPPIPQMVYNIAEEIIQGKLRKN